MKLAQRAFSLVPGRICRAIASHNYRNPIFVVGTNKVGKGLLGRALNCHPSVLTPFRSNESPFVAFVGTLINTLETCTDDIPLQSGTNDPRTYLSRTVRVPLGEIYESLRRLCYESVTGPNYGVKKLVGRCMSRRDLSICSSRSHWCAETFPSEEACRGLLRLFPEARFIYIVRNGIAAVQARIDAVFSKTNRKVDLELPCRHWADGVEQYGYLASVDAALVVRFEDMVSQPQRFFAEVFDFVGLEGHPAPAEFIRRNLATGGDNDVPTAPGAAPDSSSAPYAAWTSEERTTFLRICGAAMQKMGYEIPFEVPPASATLGLRESSESRNRVDIPLEQSRWPGNDDVVSSTV